ncbi:MAG: flagellar hook-associated protein FlgK [Lachnospiraceae bacterium]|nr:flagellar hook-associated protein FlgK [Lachnospiraceae bacterium]
MPSQFFGLNISYTGLVAANASLNTTANNISNVETEGYSRQQAVQEANRALRTYTTYGCAGAGVDTVAIERIRDEFYDTKFRDNNEKVGESEIKAYYMKSIENYFTDSDTSAGFNTSFNLMFNALEELAKNPGDSSVKSQFAMYTQSICDYFNNLSTQLSELQKDVNQEIKDTVYRINSIAEQVSTLNKQINVIELTGSHANELRDKRALLIDELSKYVAVETIETPIKDANNGYDTGANRYQVKICGGQTLVDTNEYYTIDCKARETHESINQSDVDGLYNLEWSHGDEFNIYNPMIGGKLQGLIEMRDGNNTENFRGTVVDVDLKTKKVKIDVSGLDYLSDLDKCILPTSGGVINLGVERYYYTDWTYEYDPASGECYYTFTIDDENYGENKLSSSRNGKECNVGVSLDYQGIPYYQEQLNEFARLFSRTFNELLTGTNPDGSDTSYDSHGNPGGPLLLANQASGGQFEFGRYQNGTIFAETFAEDKDYAAGDSVYYEGELYTFNADHAAGAWNAAEANKVTKVVIRDTDTSYYRLTAANLAISEAISADPTLLGTHTGKNDGVSKADVVERLINMKTDKTVLSFRGGSASEFLQSVLSDVALNAQRANNATTYYNTMSDTIDTQRLSVFGVDSDEEAVALVKFQNAYNLASKMVQTFTEIYDRLILQTGV